MGKTPSSNRQVMRNVPRSNVAKAASTVGGSLWNDEPSETQMVQTTITAARLSVIYSEGERSESVSSTTPLTNRKPEGTLSAV